MDSRKVLEPGTELMVDNHRKLVISDCAGCGGSCVVYNAQYYDAMDVVHKVRVKECYPYYLMITRDEQGNLLPDQADQEKFERAKHQFAEAYRKNTEFRKIHGLVNSTSNTNEIFEWNQTVYSMLTYDEGMDYGQYQDESLKELLEHVRAVAVVIEKYHQNGYLHLDIKPENVLIVPETTEHILLFDFDSVVRMEDLGKEEYRMSFSDGFSAPEQVRGKLGDIGTHSDIFSLGGMLFYKLFGRKVQMKDCSVNNRFDFSQMLYQEEGFSPKLFRKLDRILRKSISLSTRARWSDVGCFIEMLDEIIELADTDRQFVYDNFSYNSAFFAGRKTELARMQEILGREQVVFLSGIGGIGKTELAKRYAFANRENYNRVIFCSFEDTIQNMVIGPDLRIHLLNKDKEEENAAFFARKLELLKELLYPDDLVIVDNFDVEQDDDLESLLGIPCKFIFTTREDYSDYNYPQIYVDYMDDFEDILEVFEYYNTEEYKEQESQAVASIIELVDRHTMTVELIAKYLRDSDETPTSLYRLFLQKEGITSTQEEVRVKNRKDKKLRSKSVNDHLRILFDISGFNVTELELIMSMSLLGNIRISKRKLKELCHMASFDEDLSKLIRRGWIQQSADGKKVMLHQVIMDLIYHDQCPSAKNCPHIVAGMTEYLEKGTANRTEYQVRNNLAGIFMKRVDGDDLAYASLCAAYGSSTYLEKAEKICIHSDDPMKYHLLYIIYRSMIRNAPFQDDMAHVDYLDEVFWDKTGELCRWMHRAAECARRYSTNNSYLTEAFVNIGLDAAKAADGYSWMADEKEDDRIDSIYLEIEDIYNQALEYMEASDLEPDRKIALLKTMQKMYTEINCFTLSQTKNLMQAEKAFVYQAMINEIRAEQNSKKEEEDVIVLHPGEVSYEELAQEYEEEGEYEKAIDACRKGFDSHEMIYDQAWGKISDLYERMGDREKAIEYRIKILDADKNVESRMNQGEDLYFVYSFEDCFWLCNTLLDMGREQEARVYIKEMHHYAEKQIAESTETDFNDLHWMVCSHYLLWLTGTEEEKEKHFERCITYFSQIDRIHEVYPDTMFGFIQEYVKRLTGDSGASEENMEEALNIVSNMAEYYDNKLLNTKLMLLQDVVNASGDTAALSRIKILALLKMSMIYNDTFNYNDTARAVECCEQAKGVYESMGIPDEYLNNKIKRVMAEVYYECFGMESVGAYIDMMASVNFILIAETEGEGKTLEQQLLLWEEAVSDCQMADAFKQQQLCLERYYQLVTPLLDREEYTDYNQCSTNLNQLIEICLKNGNVEKAMKYTWEIYERMLEHYLIYLPEQEESHSSKSFLEKLGGQLQCFSRIFRDYDQRLKILLEMLSVCAYFGQETDSAFYHRLRYFYEQDDADLFVKVKDYLEGEVSYRQIDIVVDLWKDCNMEKLSGEFYEKYKTLFEWFLLQYQNQDIEFK